MTKVCLLFELGQKILLREQPQNSIHSCIYDVKFTKQMLLIVLVDLPLADEDMIK